MRYAWLFFFLFIAQAVNAETVEDDEQGLALKAQIVEIVNQAHKVDGFNGSIAVKVSGYPVMAYAVGEQDKGQKLTVEHLFSSGSVGKEFTTVALLKLRQNNQIDFNDSILKYLDFLPEWAADITIEHLLAHTSGLPKIGWKKGITTEDVMSQVMQLKKVAFAPGSGYLYSNVNVVLRAKIIEKVTAKHFEEYLESEFFAPLAMHNTVQVTLAPPDENIVVGDYPTAINGVTLYTTPTDLMRWELALLDGSVLSGAPIQQFLDFHPLSGRANHAAYDFGLFTQDEKRITSIEHDGSNPSHHVLKYSDLNRHISFVAMSSDGNKSTLYQLKQNVMAVAAQFTTSG